jgi:hypothetical protein
MANAFKNTSLVTKFAIKEFLNALVLGNKIDRQLDETKVFSGKVGATVSIRRPVYFAASDGDVIEVGEVSDIEEGIVSFTLDQRKKVVFSINSQDMTLEVAQMQERYIKPAMEELAQDVETAIAGQYKYIPNLVGTPGTSPASFLVLAQAKAKLANYGVPLKNLCAFFDPDSAVTMADALKAVFVQKIAKRALEEAEMGRYAGFDVYECQSIASHTVGISNDVTGTPLVNGASQNVTYAASKDTWTQSLITDGWSASQTGILKAGDVFTIANVYQVNRRTRASTGNLQQFVVTADADTGATGGATFTISPPIITTGAFQTVDSAPANDAAITVATGSASTAYRQSLAFHKNWCTLAFAQLDLPTDGASAARQNYKNVSIRAVRQYDISLDKTIFRFDILYGLKVQNPEFACRITD